MLRVMLYVQDHLDEPHSIDALARIARFSPFHFHRIFRGMAGESLMAHVKRLRLERAAHHLSLTNRPVAEIATAAGYESHESFSRAFQGHFGVSPSRFRRQPRAGDQPGGTHGRDPLDAVGDAAHWADVRIVNFSARHVAFVRHIGPYQGAGRAWGPLLAWAGSHALDTKAQLAIAYDDPEITPAEHLRYDACIEAPASIEPTDPVQFQTIEGGDYAVYTHVGAYEKLGEAYLNLYGRWLPASGREARACPSVLRYLTPMCPECPASQRTEVCAPLESEPIHAV